MPEIRIDPKAYEELLGRICAAAATVASAGRSREAERLAEELINTALDGRDGEVALAALWTATVACAVYLLENPEAALGGRMA